MRVGVIGCGTVATKGHIPAFRKLGLNVVGVADSSKVALRRISAKRKYTDYKKLLDQNLEIVSICAPPFLHHEMCLEAAERGINILVEKPLALTVEEGRDIKKAVEENAVKLSVVHNYKYLDPLIKAKRMQETGQLGRLLSVNTFVHSHNPYQTKGWRMNEKKAGSMISQWNHPLYINTWFAGKPKSVFAIGKKVVIPDYPSLADIRVLIDFDESTGYIEMSEFCSCPGISFNLVGTGASLSIKPPNFKVLAPSLGLEAVEDMLSSVKNVGRVFRMYLDMRFQSHKGYTWGSHFALIKDFVESLKSNGKVPADVDEGILSIRIATAIDDSIRIGNKITI